jgi:aspartate 1-decarboxylase
MRNLINLLNEATIADYPMGTSYLVSGSDKGRAMAAALAHQGINVEEPMVSVDQSEVDPKEIKATVGKNAPSVASQAFRDADNNLWIYYGSASGMNSCFVHADKLANRGEIAEGILGAAMFAKFTKRAPSAEIAQVTVQDIERILGSLNSKEKDIYSVTVKDADNKHADTITFDLFLKTKPYQDLMDLKKRDALKSEFSSAAAYVNTPNAERYSRYFYINGKADSIEIIANGALAEKSSKVDVFVQVNGKKLRLNTSLKVGGVKQFGQVGGSEIESMTKLWRYFGVDISKYTKKYEKMRGQDQFQALEYMYRSIADQLSAELAGDNDTEEAKFVTNISNAVSYFATLGEKNVELVDFSKGGFKILRFNDLVQKLRGVNLTASYKEAKGRPEIGIHDVANPKRELVSVRVKIENKKSGEQYVRNIIEKGPLLEELTTVQKGSFTAPTGSKAVPRTPVAPAPATATKPVAKPAPKVEPEVVDQPEEVDNTEYAYSESVRPKRGLSETKRQRRT